MALWDYTLPVGQRGYRTDSQTFILEYDGIAYREAYILRMHFEGNRMVMEAKERTCQSSVRFEGRLQKR